MDSIEITRTAVQTAESRIHPVTGKTLSRQVRAQVVSFGSLSESVEVPGWYPDDDSDSIHSGADLTQSEETFARLRNAYGDHVRAIRKALGLTQGEAGNLVGGGPRAFQKYEKGLMPPSDTAVGLLEIPWDDPAKIELLKRLRKTRPPVPDKGQNPMPRRKAGRRDRATA